MGKLFGTDGIRGVANTAPMTADLAMKVGQSTAYALWGKHRHPKIIIGKDTRLSGYMIENALTAGIASMGVEALLVGPLPTPGIAFITCSMRADAGIVISASHNPYEYNGIKIFGSDGFKLPDEMENTLEELILSGEVDRLPRPGAADVGRARRIDDAQGRYIVFLKSTFPTQLTLEGMKLVVDCANGAAYKVAPTVFEELGAEVILTGDRPNGKNINRDCGALHPQQMAAMVRENGADAGIAFDGDADRVIFADEKGDVLDGDELMAICGTHFLKQGSLQNNTVVATVMSNIGLELALKKAGGQIARTLVGDRYVVEHMRANSCSFGGEQSGHLVFLGCSTTGDGILSALQVLGVMLLENKPLSELKRVMERLPQKLHNVAVRHIQPIENFPELVLLQKKLEVRLGNECRILIRPSGTEPVIRIMVEGPDDAVIDETIEEMADGIRRVMDRD
jgi:phosphoglucosamine mutase